MKVSRESGWRAEPDFALSPSAREDIARHLPHENLRTAEATTVVERAIRQFLADRGGTDDDVSNARVSKQLRQLRETAGVLMEMLRRIQHGEEPSDRAIRQLIDCHPSVTEHPEAQLPEVYELARRLREDLNVLTWSIDILNETLEDFPRVSSTGAKFALTTKLALIWEACVDQPAPRTKGEGPWPAFLETVGGVQVPVDNKTCDLSSIWSPSYALRWWSERTVDKSANKDG